MIEKKTVIDQIEITRSGHVQIRFALILAEDGEEIASSFHRTSIEPGGDVDLQIAAVNADITSRPTLRAAQVETDKLPLLKGVCRLAHTPDVVAAHKARIEQEQRFQPNDAKSRR